MGPEWVPADGAVMDVALWVVQLLLAVLFAGAGAMKATQPIAVVREKTGPWVDDVPHPLIRVVGALEVLAAIGLVVPALVDVATDLVWLAAAGLVVTMIGAVLVHGRRREWEQLRDERRAGPARRVRRGRPHGAVTSPGRTAGWWSERVLPHVVDASCGSAMMRPLRERACHGLHGRVLELGIGSGRNCDLYPAEVTEVLAVEPSDTAWEMSARRREAAGVPVRRSGLDGARLDLPDGSVDCVLSTFTLCTIPDVDAALREVRRVLVPGGTLHVAEHGLSPDATVARWQHRLDGLQGRLLGGCHLVRDVPALLAGAGFADADLRSGYVERTPALGRPWSWTTSGAARLSPARGR